MSPEHDEPEEHEPFEPRTDDHLVEPMFAGLGVDAEERDEEPPPELGFLARIRRALFGDRR